MGSRDPDVLAVLALANLIAQFVGGDLVALALFVLALGHPAAATPANIADAQQLLPVGVNVLSQGGPTRTLRSVDTVGFPE